MRATALAKNYGSLTPEERFRLILAASGRGDDAERDRLANAGARMGLAVPGHFPFAIAFQELSALTFMELADAAALYADANHLLGKALNIASAHDEEHDSTEDMGKVTEPGEEPQAAVPKGDPGKRPAWTVALEIVYVAGFILRTKADGWKLFCSRLTVPPFLLWDGFPGFDRLQRSLALTEKSAFTAEGFLRWLNTRRPVGTAELTEVPLTVEGVADANEKVFRERAAWWDG